MSTALKIFTVFLNVVLSNGNKSSTSTNVRAENRSEAAKFAKSQVEHRPNVSKASVRDIR